MIRLIQFMLTLVTMSFRSRFSLQAENAALRHQLSLFRKSELRQRIRPADRLLWSAISRLWSNWLDALFFIRHLSSYLKYYHPWRTHQSLAQDAPDGRPVRVATPCSVVEFPAVHGLHHIYVPKAA